MERADDFERRRSHLKDLSDDALKDRFWNLADQIVAPLVEEARTHTSPSIERSVLLRMGFSSQEAGVLVAMALDRGLLGRGLGALVLKAACISKLGIREAGLAMLDGKLWE